MPTDASFSVSVILVCGESILVWDEVDEFNVDEESERVPRAVGRVPGAREQMALQAVLKIEHREAAGRRSSRGTSKRVDEVLFGGSKSGVKGWVCEQEGAVRMKPERSGSPLLNPEAAAPNTETSECAHTRFSSRWFPRLFYLTFPIRKIKPS